MLLYADLLNQFGYGLLIVIFGGVLSSLIYESPSEQFPALSHTWKSTFSSLSFLNGVVANVYFSLFVDSSGLPELSYFFQEFVELGYLYWWYEIPDKLSWEVIVTT